MLEKNLCLNNLLRIFVARMLRIAKDKHIFMLGLAHQKQSERESMLNKMVLAGVIVNVFAPVVFMKNAVLAYNSLLCICMHTQRKGSRNFFNLPTLPI